MFFWVTRQDKALSKKTKTAPIRQESGSEADKRGEKHKRGQEQRGAASLSDLPLMYSSGGRIDLKILITNTYVSL